MNRKQLWTLSLLAAATALGVGGTAAGLKANWRDDPEAALLAMAAHADWHGRQHRRGSSAAGDIEARTERLIGFVERTMTFTPDQKPAWDELARRLRAAGTSFAEARDNADAATGNAKQRMAQAENVMAAGLAAVQSVRPAFAAFYDTLSPAQQKALDAFVAHPHDREAK